MNQRTKDLGEKKAPREWDNATYPGSYRIATRIGETAINPGKPLKFEQYITGYGEASSVKIQCFISSDLFVNEESWISDTLYYVDNGQGSRDYFWGKNTHKIDGIGYTVLCSGVKAAHWKEATVLIDASDNINKVMTEVQLGKAPFEFHLVTRKNANPGNHYLDFYLTYFSGAEWVTHNERVQFKINNKFEKHNGLLSLLAAIALIVTITHDGIGPVLDTCHEIGKFVMSLRSS